MTLGITEKENARPVSAKQFIRTYREGPIMYERMHFAIVSSWTKQPDEKVILTYETEEKADEVRDLLANNSVEESAVLGKPSYRVALVRISEMPEMTKDGQFQWADVPDYNDHSPLV